jgi:hypothetical protein
MPSEGEFLKEGLTFFVFLNHIKSYSTAKHIFFLLLGVNG